MLATTEKLIAAFDNYSNDLYKRVPHIADQDPSPETQTAAREVNKACADARQFEKKLIDDLKVKIIMVAGNLNDHADKKDGNRNRVNYGVILNAAQTLYMLGISVDIACWEDENGYLRVSKVTIDGKETEYHNGK